MATSGLGNLAVITVDTESDNVWTDRLNPSMRNVAALHVLASILRRFSARATCLVSYRVADNPQAVAILRELVDAGLVEVGSHLHPWENPPFMADGMDRRYHTYPQELPLVVFRQKLEALTERIAENFDRPVCYRGGRWGLAPQHVGVLEELGYLVDTSVTPLLSWRAKKDCPSGAAGAAVATTAAPHISLTAHHRLM